MKFNQNLIATLILSLIFGFLAGVIGFSWADLNLVQFPFWSQIDFSQIGFDRQIVINQPGRVTVNQDLQIKQIESDLLPTLVNIYLTKKTDKALSQVYLPGENLGQGLILTADGWLITTKSVISNAKVNYLAIAYQGKKYEIKNIIIDETTGVVFAKLAASNLPVIKLGSTKELVLGQTLAIALGRDQLAVSHLRKIGYDFKSSTDAVQPSESFNKHLFLDLVLNKGFNGAAVANLKGEVVGLINDGQIIMVDYFKNVVDQVLAGKAIVRPILKVNYFDLAQTDGLIDFGDKGALVYSNPAADSPAYGKLQANDLIKKVDDIELNTYQSLSEVVGSYRPGEGIDLLLSRNGQEQTIGLTLK